MDDDVQHEVVIADTARQEGEKYADFILEKSNDSVASDQWWNGLLDAIFSLEVLPARCPLIDEIAGRELYVRQLLYEKHRILFQLQPGIVRILRIYHASRKPIASSALRRARRS